MSSRLCGYIRAFQGDGERENERCNPGENFTWGDSRERKEPRPASYAKRKRTRGPGPKEIEGDGTTEKQMLRVGKIADPEVLQAFANRH